jgi:hypothetical protein
VYQGDMGTIAMDNVTVYLQYNVVVLMAYVMEVTPVLQAGRDIHNAKLVRTS